MGDGLDDSYFVEYEDASLAGIFIVMVTLPTSFLTMAVGDLFGVYDPEGVAGEIVRWSLWLLIGFIQAAIGWVILRGRRVIPNSEDALDHPIP